MFKQELIMWYSNYEIRSHNLPLKFTHASTLASLAVVS